MATQVPRCNTRRSRGASYAFEKVLKGGCNRRSTSDRKPTLRPASCRAGVARTHRLVLKAPLTISPLCCRMRRRGLTVNPTYVRPLDFGFLLSSR